MTANGTERAIGQLQSSVESLTRQQADMDAKVDRLIVHMERQKGGWKVFALVAGGIGGLTGFIAKYIPHT